MSFLKDLFGTGYANQGFDWAKGNLGGYVGTGNQANSDIASLLGLGGDSAKANAGFQNYLNSSGYKFNLKSGDEAITSNAASKGLLNSGATGKGLETFGQNLGSTYFNNYLGQLSGLAGNGLQAGGVIANNGTQGGGTAGQLQSNGLGSLLGMGLGFLGI